MGYGENGGVGVEPTVDGLLRHFRFLDRIEAFDQEKEIKNVLLLEFRPFQSTNSQKRETKKKKKEEKMRNTSSANGVQKNCKTSKDFDFW